MCSPQALFQTFHQKPIVFGDKITKQLWIRVLILPATVLYKPLIYNLSLINQVSKANYIIEIYVTFIIMASTLCCVAVCCQQFEWARVCFSGNFPTVEIQEKCRHISTSAAPHWINGYVGVKALVSAYLFNSFTVCGKMMQQVPIFYLKIDS